MIGIKDVAVYRPDLIDNLSKHIKHGVAQDFIGEKIGFSSLAKKNVDQKASDLCVLAFLNLSNANEIIKQVDCICVCTQNGDYQLPHTSAVVHGKLGFSESCAAFDINLGCSGYPYALHLMRDFMQANGLSCGLLFTADPYSDIIDESDKNTDLLFGDASTVTLLANNPVFSLEKAVFGTAGKNYEMLIRRDNEYLFMNGREIFNFVMRKVPPLVDECLKKNNLSAEEVDRYFFHQASKYVFEKLAKRLKVDSVKMPFTASEIGNTVSSTIPVMLESHINDKSDRCFLLCGFGVGLSMAATIIRRKINDR